MSLQVWRIPSPRGRAREGANLLVDNILHVDTIGGFWELKVASCFKTVCSSTYQFAVIARKSVMFVAIHYFSI